MGYYTGFKYQIKLKEEYVEFFKKVAKYDLELTDLPISKVPLKYLPRWLDYLNDSRKDWLVGGGSAYFDQDDWKTEFNLSNDGVFYSSGSLKDYEDTIEKFSKLLPMFGEDYILISVGEDWVYEGDLELDIVKSEKCTLTFDLLKGDNNE